jgi:hypothetical protein
MTTSAASPPALSLLKTYASPVFSSMVPTVFVVAAATTTDAVATHASNTYPIHYSSGGWTPTTEKIAKNVVAHALDGRSHKQQNVNDTPTSKYICTSPPAPPENDYEECRYVAMKQQECVKEDEHISFEGWTSCDIDTFHKLVGMGVCNKFGYSGSHYNA